MHMVFFFIVNQPFTIFFYHDSWNDRSLVSWSYFFFLSLVFSSVKASDGLFLDDKLEDSRFSELEKPNLNRDMLSDACVWEIDLTYNAEKWHQIYTLRCYKYHSRAPSRAHYVTKYLLSRLIITNDTMLCARGRHAPQRESLAFSVRLHSWGGWRRWKWERKGWNGVGLQVTRPTALLKEIIAFGWHLFTNSCTQNLLAQRASGESVFGCPTENLLVPGNRTGGNFEPWIDR